MIEQDASDAKEMEKAVIKKVMGRLIPLLGVLYLFNMLDRTNVSVAKLTMQPSLHFTDSIYGLGFGIFYIGYFLLEVPSNLIMERVGASRWIARIMISWGAISAATMYVHTPMQFYSMRFLLGLAEAGFFPGIVLYITYWIPASARAQVMARFLAWTAILGLIGFPLNWALLKLNGFWGLAGWQWLFLMEGIPSILLGIAVIKAPSGYACACHLAFAGRKIMDCWNDLARSKEPSACAAHVVSSSAN